MGKTKLNDNIRVYRQAANMDQSELGTLMHVSGKTVSSWELGNSNPSIEQIYKLCDIFKIDANTLFGMGKSRLVDRYIKSKPEIRALIDKLLGMSK